MQELQLPWFTWWEMTTELANDESDGAQICRLLISLGCHDQGLWKGACPCSKTRETLQLDPSHLHSSANDEPQQQQQGSVGGVTTTVDSGASLGPDLRADWVIDPHMIATSHLQLGQSVDQAASASQLGGQQHHRVLPRASSHCVTWRQFYSSRGLPSQSPVALVLHWVLTLYLALITADDLSGGLLLLGGEHQLEGTGRRRSKEFQEDIVHLPSQNQRMEEDPSHRAEKRFRMPGGEDLSPASGEARENSSSLSLLSASSGAHVLFLGPREELTMLPALEELRGLLPGTSLSIHFVGPDVPSAWHGTEASLPSPSRTAVSAARSAEACEQLLDDGVEESWQAWMQRVRADSPTSHCRPASLSDGAASPSTFQADLHGHEAAPVGMPLRMSFWQAYFHDIHEMLSTRYGLHRGNTVVFAPNAGLSAYPSWVPTMRLLLTSGGSVEPSTTQTTKNTPQSMGSAADKVAKSNSAVSSGRLPAVELSSGGSAELSRAVGPMGECVGQAPDQDGMGHMTCVITDFCEEALLQGRVGLRDGSRSKGNLHGRYMGMMSFWKCNNISMVPSGHAGSYVRFKAHSHTADDQPLQAAGLAVLTWERPTGDKQRVHHGVASVLISMLAAWGLETCTPVAGHTSSLALDCILAALTPELSPAEI